MEDSQKREFTGVWIPRELVEDEDLNWTDRAVYAEISCYKSCFASNEFLSKRIGVSIRMIQNIIGKLKKMGYLHETGFDGRKRYLSTNQTCKKLHGRGEENCTPRVKKIAPIDNSIDNSVDNTYLQPQADCDVEPEPIENIPLKPEDDPRLIAEVIKQFEGINPTCKTYYGNKTQRKSCSDLIKIYGFEETLHIIAEVLPQSNGKILMAPITTPAELLRDMAKLKAKISQQMNMEFRDFKNKTPAKVDIVNGVPIKRQN